MFGNSFITVLWKHIHYCVVDREVKVGLRLYVFINVTVS